MKLSIILISWNSFSFLKECLASLQDIRRDGVEIILVDNGSVDGTIEQVHQIFPFVRTEALSVNKGVAYARNRGVELSTGDYILFLDDDTVANTQAIEGMYHFLEANPLVGICGCKLVDNHSQVQESCKCYPGFIFKWNNAWISIFQKRGMTNMAHKISDYNTKYTYGEISLISAPFEPVYLIGACQMIRRKVFQKIGLLDEHIFYGPEDADFCIRAAKSGWKIIYLPQYSIIHHWKRITNRRLFSKIARKHIKALCYFYHKNQRWL